MNSIEEAGDSYRYPYLKMSPNKIVALTEYLMYLRVDYRLGAKIEPLSRQDGRIKSVDCSGFVRWAIYHATDQKLVVPDGSFNQHDWVKREGFKPSEFESGYLKDEAIRIAFLSPGDGGGIGHVMLVVNGLTCESHGHESNGSGGPDRRAWGSESFMKKCSLYVLVPPHV